ncbi:cyanophycin metabolism-associated DUF1854 family protein [Ideonella livida]|uniref:DUF1854 domain-containing protein n=1 Tax=Ideonella livida TaxID=2707176 RepID=A0A7C9PGN5_9BURK|nr:DUF1854 domain-containing protein [Ideonella livida]NDY91209.1 DUF1854 domain-containing protein [Ideonella livida]
MPPFTLHRDGLGRLRLTDAQGTVHEDVQPVRAFPLAAPEQHISLMGRDGHELVWIDHLDQLPASTRQVLEAELAQRECLPVIQRIDSVSTFATPSQWQVQTDRGPTTLLLKAEEDIRRLPESGRLLITSGHGIAFLVQDRFALDRSSRRLLERFL